MTSSRPMSASMMSPSGKPSAGLSVFGAFVTSHELYPAVRYGVNGLEHVKGTSRRGFSPKMTDLGRSYQDVRTLIAESGVFFTPTMLIYGGWELALAREPDLVSSDRRIQAFPAWLASSLTAPREPSGNREAQISRNLALMRPMWETVNSIAAAGGRIIAGTDTPIVPYGLGLVVEVEQLAEAGLGPAGALRAATLTAAAGPRAGRGTGRHYAGGPRRSGAARRQSPR